MQDIVRPLVLGRTIARHHGGAPRALAAVAGAAALLAATALAAYGSRDPVGARRDISGTYAVSTAAGKPLPATVLDTGLASPSSGPTAHLTIVVTGGAIALTAAGTYTAQIEYTLALNGDVQAGRPPAARGRYLLAGSTITFLSPAGEAVATGTFTDRFLAISGRLFATDAIRRWCSLNPCTARPS